MVMMLMLMLMMQRERDRDREEYEEEEEEEDHSSLYVSTMPTGEERSSSTPHLFLLPCLLACHFTLVCIALHTHPLLAHHQHPTLHIASYLIIIITLSTLQMQFQVQCGSTTTTIQQFKIKIKILQRGIIKSN